MPVILVTGWRPDADDLVGVGLCLDKPFSVQELLDKVAAVLQDS